MNQFFRSLSPQQQVGALFVLVFGLLMLASITTLLLSLRDRPDTPEAHLHRDRLREVSALLRTSWAVVTVFWLGWTLGDGGATVLFAIVAFFSLREFMTLSPTRRGDHRSLVHVTTPAGLSLVSPWPSRCRRDRGRQRADSSREPPETVETHKRLARHQ